MQTGRFLGLAILTVALGSPSAYAGPITGSEAPPAVADAAPAASGGSSSDTSYSAGGGAAATATSFSAGALFDPVGTPLLRTSGPIYLELGARGKLRGGGGDGGAGAGGDAGYAGAAVAPGIGNVNPLVPLGSGGDPLGGVGAVQVPEPASLLLLAPAAAIALRRRSRARK
jgi:hypothetical protein